MAESDRAPVSAELTARLRRAARGLEPPTAAFLQELVRIPIENPKLAPIEPDGQDVGGRRLRELGATGDRWDVYPGRTDPVGTFSGSGGAGASSFILNGHANVVPAGDPAA